MAIINITADNFKEQVLDNPKTVLLDFWATWCGPCMMISPIVDEIAEENPAIVVGKVNVDEQPGLAQAFGIESIPTLITVKDGNEVGKLIGLRPKEDILNLINH